MENNRLPAVCFPPGKHLKNELDARGVSVDAFAVEVDIDSKIIAAIISGEQHIDSSLADRLGSALGVSSAFWINLQNNYDEWLNAPSNDYKPAKLARKAR